MIQDYLVKLLHERKNIEDSYGPLEIVSQEELVEEDVSPSLIWTVKSSGLDSVISNGLIECGDQLEFYYKAAKPCLQAFESLTAIDVLGFECDDCEELEDPDECLSCQGSQNIFIDLQEVISRNEIDFSSADAIWSQRVPGGTFGEICVPADYDNSAHTRSLPRPPWLIS